MLEEAMSIPLVVFVSTLTATTTGALVALFFMSKINRDLEEAYHRLATRSEADHERSITTLREANLSLERMATDQIQLEQRRIESRRLRRAEVTIRHELGDVPLDDDEITRLIQAA